MKEIKTYIQRCYVNRTVDALEKNAAPGITIVDIHPVGYGYEPNNFAIQCQDAYKRYGHLQIVNPGVVCADNEADHLVSVIRRECQTGGKGNGMIFVADIANALRIRDGASWEAAL